MLLHWTHLSPESASAIAAVRFTSPVRVSSVRIFPHGCKPFLQDSSIVSQTKPNSFFLDVYLTAHAVKDKEKPTRPPNTLAASKIAYAGRLTDFSMSLGEEFVTRLMIFRGSFETITLAIYGSADASPSTVVTEHSASIPSYIEMASPRALPSALDPASAQDPTHLAVQLLALIPKTVPSLPLITRLMFCVKATDEMWEDARFPFIYSHLDDSEGELEVSRALEIVELRLPDDTPSSTVKRFAEKVAQCFSDSNSLYKLCRFLSDLASQPISIVLTVLECLDIVALLDPHALDERSFALLVEAATNPAIANKLDTPYFTESLQDVASPRARSTSTQPAAHQLARRIQSSLVFEDCLVNPNGDFKTAVAYLKELGRQEICLGTWLISIMSHPSYFTKMKSTENIDSSCVPSLFDSGQSMTHEGFMALTKSFIGAASTMVILAWADSWGDDDCMERIVAVLRLWQTVDGYREIVNHLLLLNQVTYRIEWITSDNESPRQSGIIAEQLLSELATDPRNLVDPANDALVQCVLSLKQPLSHLSESDRLLLRKLALVAEDGLPAAVEEIAYSSDRPLSLRRSHTLRLAIAIIQQHLQKGSDRQFEVLQALWDENRHGLITLLVELVIAVAQDLKIYTLDQKVHLTDQALVEQLFLLFGDLIKSVDALIFTFPPAGRTLRSLVCAVADVFVLARVAGDCLPSFSAPFLAAQRARTFCIQSIQRLSQPGLQTDQGKPGVEVTLGTLLEHGLSGQAFDASHQAAQLAYLIEQAVPVHETGLKPDAQDWTRAILPDILPQLKGFLRILHPEAKATFLNKIAEIDAGVTGTGEWLLLQELERINDALDRLPDPDGTPYSNTMGYRATLLLRFVELLLDSDAGPSNWFISCIGANAEISTTLTSILQTIFTRNLSSSPIFSIIDSLTSTHLPFPDDLLFHILILRIGQSSSRPPLLSSIAAIAKRLPSKHLRSPHLHQAVGSMLLDLLSQSSTSLNQASLSAIRDILQYLGSMHADTGLLLPGITSLDGDMLFDQLSVDLSNAELDTLMDAKTRMIFDQDLPMKPPRYTLHEGLRMSAQDFEASLCRVSGTSGEVLMTPSTPKKPSTPEIMSLVTSSPPITLFHSPVASTTGLTKTYLNNDFRELRQLPSSRQTGTGRHPSVHVDQFLNASPTMVPATIEPGDPQRHAYINTQTPFTDSTVVRFVGDTYTNQ